MKSHSVHQVMTMEPSNVDVRSEVSGQSVVTPNEHINRQEIDLQLFRSDLQNFDVENDSD